MGGRFLGPANIEVQRPDIIVERDFRWILSDPHFVADNILRGVLRFNRLVEDVKIAVGARQHLDPEVAHFIGRPLTPVHLARGLVRVARVFRRVVVGVQIAQVLVPDEIAVARLRLPRGHETTFRHRRDQARACFGGAIRQQTERSRSLRVVATAASFEKDRRNVLRERDALGRFRLAGRCGWRGNRSKCRRPAAQLPHSFRNNAANPRASDCRTLSHPRRVRDGVYRHRTDPRGAAPCRQSHHCKVATAS